MGGRYADVDVSVAPLSYTQFCIFIRFVLIYARLAFFALPENLVQRKLWKAG